MDDDCDVSAARTNNRSLTFQTLPLQIHSVILSMLTMSERINSYLASGGLPLVKGFTNIASRSVVLDAHFIDRYLSSSEKRNSTGKYFARSGFFDNVRCLSIGTRTHRATAYQFGFDLPLLLSKHLDELQVFASSTNCQAGIMSYAESFAPKLRVLNLDLKTDGRMYGANYDSATADFLDVLKKTSSTTLTGLGVSCTIWEGRNEQQMLALVAALPLSLESLAIQPRTTLSEKVLHALLERCPRLAHLDVTCSFGLEAVPASNWDRVPRRDWISLRLRQHCHSMVPTMSAGELETLGGPLLRHFESNYKNKGTDHKAVCRFLDKCTALETIKLHVDDLGPSFEDMAVAMSKTVASASLKHFYIRPHIHSQRKPCDMSFVTSPDLYRFFPKLRVYPAESSGRLLNENKSQIVPVLADPARYNTMEYAEFCAEVMQWDAASFGALLTNSTKWKQVGVRYISKLLSATLDHKTMKHLVEKCPDLSLCCLPMETELPGELLQQLLLRTIGPGYDDRLEWHLGFAWVDQRKKLPVNTDIRLEHLVKRNSNQEIGLFNMVLGGLSFDDLVVLKRKSQHVAKSQFGFIVAGDLADAFVKLFGARQTTTNSWYDGPDSHIVFPVGADTSAVYRGEVLLTRCDHSKLHIICLGTSKGIGDRSLRWSNVPMSSGDRD
jgi:hypothetical protein